jgi:hypothetical protein
MEARNTDKMGESRDIEEVLDEEDIKIDEGLLVKDACRAAWGMAVLGGFHVESFGKVATEDTLNALSVRRSELLLAKLQQSRQGDMQTQTEDGIKMQKNWQRTPLRQCGYLHELKLVLE